MSEAQWAWLGGLFLGEGCFGVNDGKGVPNFGLSLTIGDKTVTDRLQRIFGGQSSRHSDADPTRGMAAAHRWTVKDGFLVVALVRRFLPHVLGRKGLQGKAFLKFAEAKLRMWQRRQADNRSKYSPAERLKLYQLAQATRAYAGGGSKDWRGRWDIRMTELGHEVAGRKKVA